MAQREMLADPEIRRSFEQEVLFGEAIESIQALLNDLDITRNELANRLGLSKGRVSQVLSGGKNLTLRTLADLAWALGYRFDLALEPIEDRAGTPAQDDPQPPAWVGRLTRGKRGAVLAERQPRASGAVFDGGAFKIIVDMPLESKMLDWSTKRPPSAVDGTYSPPRRESEEVAA